MELLLHVIWIDHFPVYVLYASKHHGILLRSVPFLLVEQTSEKQNKENSPHIQPLKWLIIWYVLFHIFLSVSLHFCEEDKCRWAHMTLCIQKRGVILKSQCFSVWHPLSCPWLPSAAWERALPCGSVLIPAMACRTRVEDTGEEVFLLGQASSPGMTLTLGQGKSMMLQGAALLQHLLNGTTTTCLFPGSFFSSMLQCQNGVCARHRGCDQKPLHEPKATPFRLKGLIDLCPGKTLHRDGVQAPPGEPPCMEQKCRTSRETDMSSG